MFKISIVEKHGQRRLVLEGKLVSPWTTEVESAWSRAAKEPQDRSLIVDLDNITVISQEGENTLFKLMREGARFSCGGVMTRHLLKRLAGRCRRQPPCTPSDDSGIKNST